MTRSVQDKFDRIAHLYCNSCNDNPSLALLNGNEVLVCHCTHDDGVLDPHHVHSFDNYPDPWEFESNGVTND